MSYVNGFDPVLMNSALLSGGMDYTSILRDPWFLKVSSAYNPSFKSAEASIYNSAPEVTTSNGTGTSAQQTTAAQPSTAVEGGIPVIENTNQSSGSELGTTLVTGGALATIVTSVVLLKKGKFSSLTKLLSKEAGVVSKPTKTFTMKLKDETAKIVVKDSKPVSVTVRAQAEVLTSKAEIQTKLGSVPQYYDSATGKLAKNTDLCGYTIKERQTTLTMTSPTTSSTTINDYKFVVNEKGDIVKIMKNGTVEAEGAENIENFFANGENKKLVESIQEKLKAIQEGRYDKCGELENVSFIQKIPEKNATYTYTYDGDKHELVTRGDWQKPMGKKEREEWLHRHMDEYKTQMDEIIANGTGKNINRECFALEGDDYEVIANAEGKITSIYTQPWWSSKKSHLIEYDSAEYHRWLQNHPKVEEEAKKIAESGFGTDSKKTIFQI